MFCYIQNDLHYTLLMDEVTKVKHTLWMGTADLKDLYVKYGRFAMPFLSLLEKKIKQGLSIRLLHAKEPGENFRNDFDMYPALSCLYRFGQPDGSGIRHEERKQPELRGRDIHR